MQPSPSERSPRFSVVIPAYNEERLLPRLLDTIDVARAAYRGGADAIEVLVGDNASTDRTAEIALARGCCVARVEKRSIGAARNGAAKIARGDILCFVDADMRVHPHTFEGIDDAMRDDRIVAGATGIRPERWSVGFAVTYALMIPWVVLLRMDTGVVFCRRSDFEQIGGYREDRLFAEDVALLVDLRKSGRRRGQRLTRLRKYKAIASLRKFDEFGEWHYFALLWHGLRAIARHGLHERNEFVDRYCYKPNR